MADATGRVPTNKRGLLAIASVWSVLLAADIAPRRGWLMARNADGYAVPFSEATGLVSAGRATLDVDASDDDGVGRLLVDAQVEDIDMASGDEFEDKDAPAVAYGVSNHEIGKSSAGRSIAGLFLGINPETSKAMLWSGPVAHAVAVALDGKIKASVRQVRGVVASNVADLSAFTVASNDGLTYVEGERVLLAAQTTAAQCGIYVVGAVSSGTAALTRAPDMPAGAPVLPGSVIEVAEGTVFAGSTWKSFGSSTGVIGTNDPTYWPKEYRQIVSLASGTYTIGLGSTATPDEPLFIRSATLSSFSAFRVGGTPHSSTVQYRAATITAGKAGTAALVIRADRDAGTINASDASDLSVRVGNW